MHELIRRNASIQVSQDGNVVTIGYNKEEIIHFQQEQASFFLILKTSSRTEIRIYIQIPKNVISQFFEAIFDETEFDNVYQKITSTEYFENMMMKGKVVGFRLPSGDTIELQGQSEGRFLLILKDGKNQTRASIRMDGISSVAKFFGLFYSIVKDNL